MLSRLGQLTTATRLEDILSFALRIPHCVQHCDNQELAVINKASLFCNSSGHPYSKCTCNKLRRSISENMLMEILASSHFLHVLQVYICKD